jgi:CxC5 like cysteine cluster associated with KDZ transposases
LGDFATLLSGMGLIIVSFLSSWLGWALLLAIWLPLVTTQPTSPFPDISFDDFNTFVQENYDADISLSSVLLILFTVLENLQLLNLHFCRCQQKFKGETSSTLWLDCLARLLGHRFAENEPLLHPSCASLSSSLHGLALLLNLNEPLDSVNLSAVEPTLALVTNSFECQEPTCQPHCLYPHQKVDDIPDVVLIKGTKQYSHAHVLGAWCSTCLTSYMADHRYRRRQKGQERTLENDVCYIKIGQVLWADRTFTGAVSNAFHSLRLSAQAYSVFFTGSYVYNAPPTPAPAPAPSSSPSTPPPRSTPILNAVARRHIW